MSSRSKRKENTTKQQEDAVGISRKKVKHTFSPKWFVIIKLVLIALIPILYFVYSPLLILDFLLYVGLFFVARTTEKTINRSVIKSNHIHIFKADSALALIIILIAVFGLFIQSNSKVKQGTFSGISDEMMQNFKRNFDENTTDGDGQMTTPPEMPNGQGDSNFSFDKDNLPDFSSMKKSAKTSQFVSTLKNLGSLLTGERNVFSNKTNFGTIEKPDNFINNSEDFQELDNTSSDWKDNFEERKENFSMDNIPLEFMSSSTISSVNTILIFSCAIVGLVSVVAFIIKQQKFNKKLNEVVFETKITILDDEEIKRILSFGETTEETDLSAKEINKKIKQQKEKDKNKIELESFKKDETEVKFEKDLKAEVESKEEDTDDNDCQIL